VLRRGDTVHGGRDLQRPDGVRDLRRRGPDVLHGKDVHGRGDRVQRRGHLRAVRGCRSDLLSGWRLQRWRLLRQQRLQGDGSHV